MKAPLELLPDPELPLEVLPLSVFGAAPFGKPAPPFDRPSSPPMTSGVALERTRFAERELARGELVELGSSVFKRLTRENHFFSLRTNER